MFLYLTELDTTGKVKRVSLVLAKLILLLGLLYLFICSLSFLTSAFRLLGGKKAGKNLSFFFQVSQSAAIEAVKFHYHARFDSDLLTLLQCYRNSLRSGGI